MGKWILMVISICLSGSWWFHKVQSVEASYFTIDNSNVTFTEGMVKRMAPGPFSAGVLIQGDEGNSYALTDDKLVIGRGSVVNGNFYQTFDPTQGSVVLWWTPEFSATTISSGDHYLWYVNSNYWIKYDYANDRYTLNVGGQSMNVS